MRRAHATPRITHDGWHHARVTYREAASGPPVEHLPLAAWLLAWSFLGGQLVTAAVNGFQDESAWPLSILLGAVLVAFFSYGVLRARMVRTVLVGVLLGVGALAELAGVLAGNERELLALAVTGVQLACFVWFVRSPWFAWQRGRPEGGPSLAPLMGMAVAVGVLGGLVGATDTGANFELRVDSVSPAATP